jgi:hypothetical protein
VLGVLSCAAAALVPALLVNVSNGPIGTQIIVPQAQDGVPPVPRPSPSTVSILLPSPSIGTTYGTPPPTSSQHRQSFVSRPQPPSTTPLKPVNVDFQAEDAWIRHASVQWNHAAFTGSGFVDYDNVAGGSVEWTVTATTAQGTDVVFRFANGSSEARPMVITANGVLVASVAFPVTNGWSDWRTLTVHMSLRAGSNTIRATATNANGGPNVDKITLVPLLR